MIWNVMLFLVHATAFAAFIYLYKTAPCWMQRLVVVGLIFAMGLISLGYLIDFIGDVRPAWGWWGGLYVKVFGYLIEHIAVLLYLFRLVYQQHEPKRQGEAIWQKSSEHYPA